mgnify:CR=1 FL=1
MRGSLARKIAITLSLSSAICTQTVFAEGEVSIEGEPLLTPLSVRGGEEQLVTVLDIGDGTGVFEGDVLVPIAPGISSRSAGVQAQSFSTTLEGSLWPDGVLPYAFDESLTNTARTNILAAIDHWNSQTPIRIEPRTDQVDYVNFVNNSGCASYIGRIGGAQSIFSSSACSMGNFVHEIGHALGLYHEHTRPDRNSYVTVHYDNIRSDRSSNFDIVSDNIQLNTPYDYGSIMHYGRTFFAIDGNEDTITPTNSSVSIGQRTALSDNDLNGIKALYNVGFSALVTTPARRPLPNSNITSEVTLLNNTGSLLQSTSAVITMPAGVIFQQASSTDWSCSESSQEITCSGPSLQNGAETDLNLIMQSPNELSNLAFTFNVTALNGTGVEWESNSSDTLNMTSVNDPPQITTEEVTVSKGSSNYLSPLGAVSAIDLNGHTVHNFAIQTESRTGILRIDTESGEVFATSEQALQSLEEQPVDIGVTVSDGFTESAINEIEIRIESDVPDSAALSSSGGGGAFTAFWLLMLVPFRKQFKPKLLTN